MVKSVEQDGEEILILTKEQWITAFGNVQGTMLYHKIEKEREKSEKDIISGINTIWPYISYLGTILTGADVLTALFEGIIFHKLEVTKLAVIPTACYGVLFELILTLLSLQKFKHARIIPDFSKSSHEPRVKRFLGSLEQKMHGEELGLRSRNRKRG